MSKPNNDINEILRKVVADTALGYDTDHEILTKAAHSLNELYLNKYLALLPELKETYDIDFPQRRKEVDNLNKEVDNLNLGYATGWNATIEEARKAFKGEQDG